MAKLYPPSISGTIPAFYIKGDEGAAITVPFSMNRSVSHAEISGFALKIKSVNGDHKGTILTTNTNSSYDLSSAMEVYFSSEGSNIEFNIGQYYKFQLAYIDKEGIIGYYSTVGVSKCTTVPSVSIEGLTGGINSHQYEYVGVFSQKGKDSTEKLYSSIFKVTDDMGNIIATSGEVLHNSTKDDLPYEQYEIFQFSQDLVEDKTFFIQFIATSTNKLARGALSTIKSPKYRIMQKKSIDAEIQSKIKATLDYDNGLIKLSMIDNKQSSVSGTFLISRACSLDNYIWRDFKRFDLHGSNPKDWEIIDCTIEQGVSYKYSLQQYNSNGIYSNRIISNVIFADFEDSFLYDGEKQLKIRFNPKISNFKNDIPEAKLETLGSKHPFIVRNGNVNYREFSLGGLISHQMDEKELFLKKTDMGLKSTIAINSKYVNNDTFYYQKYLDLLKQAENATNKKNKEKLLLDAQAAWKEHEKYTEKNDIVEVVYDNFNDLTSSNISAERVFKVKVLDWLSNGKPKLFRSPTEGNFIIRLMNVSMTPNDTLGRMLHSFTATGYEIAELTVSNLESYGLIDSSENLSEQTRWTTIDLANLEIGNNQNIKRLTERAVYMVSFSDMVPGTKIYIGDAIDYEEIVIGVTGSYFFESTENPITFIGVNVNPAPMQGLCTYSYKTMEANIFGTISDINSEDIPLYQAIGRNYMTEKRIFDNGIDWGQDGNIEYDKFQLKSYQERLNYLQEATQSLNLLTYLNDIRSEVLNYYYLRFWKREVGEIFVVPASEIYDPSSLKNKYYFDMYQKEPINDLKDPNSIDPLAIYRIRLAFLDNNMNRNDGYYYDALNSSKAPYLDYVFDGMTKQILPFEKNLFEIQVNDEFINIEECEKFEIPTSEIDLQTVIPGIGVVTELGYCKQVKTFSFDSDFEVSRAYRNMVALKRECLEHFNEEGYVNKYKNAYEDYIRKLADKIFEYREATGVIS